METGMEYEFKEFMENVYGDGSYEKHYVKGPAEEKERFERQYQALREKKIKDFMEKSYGEGSYDKHYVNGPQEEKDRFTMQYDALQDKAFKEFMEQTYGAGAYERHYVNGPAEEKERFERQFFALQKKAENEQNNENNENNENNDVHETENGAQVPEEKQTETTINQSEEIETPEAVNTDNSHADEPEWKKMRREAWEKYAADNQQEFKLLSEDKAPDLSMSVGDTPIKYADEHNVTMGNGEYAKFLKAVEIEKNAKTDIINFGKIESEEYKAKLAAACIQMGMRMKNGPKSIDLSLECFKDLDNATKAKIEEYNKKQAEKENNAEKPKEENREEKPAEENKYKKLFDDKVKEFSDKKEKGESLDFSQIQDPVERMVAYAAAKESKLKIENLSNYEKLVDSKLDDKAKAEVAAARAALPENSQNHLKARETWEQKLVEIKGRLKNKEQKRGQYHDKDGNLVDSKLSVHDQDGKLLQNVERNKVEYKIETQENGQKKKTYERDDAGLFKLRQQQGRGSR